MDVRVCSVVQSQTEQLYLKSCPNPTELLKGSRLFCSVFTEPELLPACKMCLNNNESGGKLRPFEKTAGAENVVRALRLRAEGPFLQSLQGQMSLAVCAVSGPAASREMGCGNVTC